jgi:hypothetical protein
VNITTESINDAPRDVELREIGKKVSKLKSEDMQFHANGERLNQNDIGLGEKHF